MTFDEKDVKQIESATDLATAQELLLDILDRSSKSSRPISVRKNHYLKLQALRARSVMDVTAIAYNMLLSGEGLASLESRYMKW